MAKPRVKRARPERCCFTCRHWSGKVLGWHEVGETRGTCLWLVNLAVTHSSIGIPPWVYESRPVRMMCDDDGEDCGAWQAGGADDALPTPAGDPA